MPIGDILPQFPWEGPPLPRGIWERQLTQRLQESTLLDLGSIVDMTGAIMERLSRYIELVTPYTETWEREALRKLQKELYKFESTVSEAIVAIGEIRERGLR